MFTQKTFSLFAATLGLAAFIIGCSKSDEAAAPEAPKPNATDSPTGQPSANAPTEASGFAAVKTILDSKCLMCHGEEGKEGIDLRTYASVMKGGEHGPIVVAGKPEDSDIVKALRGADGKKQMPMNMPPLDEADIAKIEAWIKEGAKE